MSNLKKIRESRGLSQSQLATAAGVNRKMLQFYEQGTRDINKSSAMTVYKLAAALRVSMEDLLEFQTEKPPEQD